MNIFVVGLSHKTAPVEIRERIAFAPTAMEKPLHLAQKLPAINEVVIVSTCNRVEIIGCGKDPEAGMQQLRIFLSEYHEIDIEELDKYLYQYHGADAIRHVFRVVSSLDSMIIGEPQILGQIKTSFGYATEFRTTGVILNRFLHKAFSVAKRVRTETKIASNAVSIPFAAVELARKIFDTLENKKVMLIGAGEMCELAAKHFLNNGVSSVTVTNRTFSRAEKLAAEFGGHAVPFDDFVNHLHQVDIILTSTGAPDYVLHHDDFDSVIRQRKQQPMFVIDIAVPRDIDPKVNNIDNIYLYDVDDLQGVVAANLKERGKEAGRAEQIVEEEIGTFHKWLSDLEVKPTIVALRRKFDAIRSSEVEKTLSRLNLGEKEQKAVESLTNAIINKLLHRPTSLLKDTQENGSSGYVDALRHLFDLNDGSGKDTE